jgi:hypothetical protein
MYNAYLAVTTPNFFPTPLAYLDTHIYMGTATINNAANSKLMGRAIAVRIPLRFFMPTARSIVEIAYYSTGNEDGTGGAPG